MTTKCLGLCVLFAVAITTSGATLKKAIVEQGETIAILYGTGLSGTKSVTLNASERTFSFIKEGKNETLAINLLPGDSSTAGQVWTLNVVGVTVDSTTLTICRQS